MAVDDNGFNHFTRCQSLSNFSIEVFMNLLLTQEEVESLTEYTKPALQRKQLQKMGIPFEPSRTGKPKVLREAVVSRLGGASKKRGSSVNIEALSRM